MFGNSNTHWLGGAIGFGAAEQKLTRLTTPAKTAKALLVMLPFARMLKRVLIVRNVGRMTVREDERKYER